MLNVWTRIVAVIAVLPLTLSCANSPGLESARAVSVPPEPAAPIPFAPSPAPTSPMPAVPVVRLPTIAVAPNQDLRVGRAVHLTLQVSETPLTIIVDWGDGTTEDVAPAMMVDVSHVYTRAGKFPVTVRVTGRSGDVAWVSTLLSLLS